MGQRNLFYFGKASPCLHFRQPSGHFFNNGRRRFLIVNLKELKRLIAQGEGLKVDFKRDLHPQSIQNLSKDIAAFANNEGGTIIVGVDDKRKVVGVDWDAEKTNLVLQEGLNCIPQLRLNIREVRYPKVGTVVAIEVPKSTWIHSDPNRRFPQRLGDRTVFMDTAMLLTLAKGRGLMATEGQFINSPAPSARQKPDNVAFLVDYLSDPSPFVRAEAVNDIANVSYNYAVEEIPNLSDRLIKLLNDVDSNVRISTLNAVGTLHYRINSRKKKELLSKILGKMIDLTVNEKDLNVRQRAYSLLCELGVPEVIPIIIQLIKLEPAETYSKLNVVNNFIRVVEAGHGHDLRRRLYEELSKTEDAETQRRFREALAGLRNLYWGR